MRDSDTYLAILEEGQVKCAKELILDLGKQKLGDPDAAIRTRLEGMTDLERLERTIHYLFDATCWPDLLNIA